MKQTFLAGQNLDECTEVHDAHNGTLVDFADLNVLGQKFDASAGLFRAFHVLGIDGDQSQIVFVNVDLDIAFVHDFVDGLSSRSDDDADLIRIDGHGDAARRILGQLRSRLRDFFLHNFHDVHSAFTGLSQRLLHDFSGEAVNLDIHLHGSDAHFRSGYLEVHIAHEIFHSLNVAEDCHLAGSVLFHAFNQSHGNARNGSADGNAGIHQCQTGSACGGHRRRTVRGQDIRNHAYRVGEFLFVREHRQQRSLRKSSVSDLTASGAAGRLRFSGGISREIVVVNVTFLRLLCQSVNALHLGKRRQCTCGQSLSLTSLEQSRAVYSRQQTRLAPDRTDLVQFSVIHTHALVQNHGAHTFLCDLEQNTRDIFFAFREFLRKMLLCLHLDGIHIVQSLQLVGSMQRSIHSVRGKGSDCCFQFFRRCDEIDVHFRLSYLGHHLVDEGNQFLDFLMSIEDGIQHNALRHFLRAGLYHHDSLAGPGYRQIDIAYFSLLQRRVDDEFSIHPSHANGSGRSVPRNIGNRQRNR